jgi:hypothetical protein
VRIEPIQYNFMRFSLQGLGWTTQQLPSYKFSGIAAALLGRELLCKWIKSTYLTGLLCIENHPYPKRKAARLMDFYHRTYYDQNTVGNFFMIFLQKRIGQRNVLIWLHQMDSFSLLMDIFARAKLVPLYSLKF